MKQVLLVGLVLLGTGSYCHQSAGNVPPPMITRAPRLDLYDLKRSPSVDQASLAMVLLTAVPESIRNIAATNLAQASKIIWSEFLDGSRPAWFTAMPTDIQTELINEFGPTTTASASMTSSPSTSAPSTSATQSHSASGFSTLPASTVAPAVSAAASAEPLTTPSSGGLSTAAKVGIGLAIPFALLVIVAIILACCLVKRRRRRRRAASPVVEERTATPAFVASTLAPKPTHSMRGGSTNDLIIPNTGVHEDPFEDPPPPVFVESARPTNARGSRASSGSYGSLTMVPEEQEHEYGGPVPPPRNSRRTSRGSRGSLSDARYETPISQAEQERLNGGGLAKTSHLDSGYGADSWQNKHPALRDSRDVVRIPTTPWDSNGQLPAATQSIPRKPVGGAAALNNNGGAAGSVGNRTTITSISSSAADHTDWPFLGTSNRTNNYRRSQPAKYDRYETLRDDAY